MPNKRKKIRILITTMLTVESELDVDEAVTEFEQNSWYTYNNTENVKVIDTEWRNTQKVSYSYVEGDTEILKPIKDNNEDGNRTDNPGEK